MKHVRLSLPYFLAGRLFQVGHKSISWYITRIAIIAIAVTVAVIICTNGLVNGFKRAISEKMFGFWGHIQITHLNNYEFEATPMAAKQTFYPNYPKNEPLLSRDPETGKDVVSKQGIAHLQPFATKEGIIKTEDQIEGIVIKGINESFDWSFMKRYLTEGRAINLNSNGSNEPSNEILLSESTARRLNLKLNTPINIHFVINGQQSRRKFTLVGIYKTGLEENDKRFALVDLRHLQILNNWRPYKHYRALKVFSDSIHSVNHVNRVKSLGSDVYITALWPDSDSLLPAFQRALKFGKLPCGGINCNAHEVLIPDMLSGYWGVMLGDTLIGNLLDGDAVAKDTFVVCGIFSTIENRNLAGHCLINYKALQAHNTKLPSEIGGFEVYLNNIKELDAVQAHVYNNWLGPNINSRTIKDLNPNIFDWLALQDMNERIILALMLLVAIVTMSTSLLILILERTNTIGILKALGMRDAPIRAMFLWIAARILLAGLFWGNLVAISLLALQRWFGFLTLDEKNYYVRVVPVEFDLFNILTINVLCVVFTMLVLILPSMVVTRVTPVKAIRFG